MHKLGVIDEKKENTKKNVPTEYTHGIYSDLFRFFSQCLKINTIEKIA